jgi:putative endonuclease
VTSRRLAGRPSAGRRAEELAADLLTRAGLRIVARNWRRPEGELDIVADDAGACVFVEVRSRTGLEMGHPLESITPQKRAQIIRVARLYLDAHPTPATAYRFDVVSVTFSTDESPPDVQHIANAFELT